MQSSSRYSSQASAPGSCEASVSSLVASRPAAAPVGVLKAGTVASAHDSWGLTTRFQPSWTSLYSKSSRMEWGETQQLGNREPFGECSQDQLAGASRNQARLGSACRAVRTCQVARQGPAQAALTEWISCVRRQRSALVHKASGRAETFPDGRTDLGNLAAGVSQG